MSKYPVCPARDSVPGVKCRPGEGGLCVFCGTRVENAAPWCAAVDCNAPANADGWCGGHTRRPDGSWPMDDEYCGGGPRHADPQVGDRVRILTECGPGSLAFVREKHGLHYVVETVPERNLVNVRRAEIADA